MWAESWLRPAMASPVASTAPAILLKPRSLILLSARPLARLLPQRESTRLVLARGSLTRYRRSRNRPNGALRRKEKPWARHDSDRADSRADGGHAAARKAPRRHRRTADDCARPQAGAGGRC